MKFILLANDHLVNLSQVVDIYRSEKSIVVCLARGENLIMKYDQDFKRDEDFAALEKLTEALVAK